MLIGSQKAALKPKSWFKNDPCDLLRQIMLESPQASEKEVFNTMISVLSGDDSYWGAIFSYWFANNYRRFYVEEIGHNSRVFVRRVSSRESKENTRQAVSKMKETLKTVLMDHLLTGGKRLRDATFGDCAREGGWLSAIAKCGHANEVVGKKLTEVDLQRLQKRFQPEKTL